MWMWITGKGEITKSSLSQNICHRLFKETDISMTVMSLKHCIGHLKFMVGQIKILGSMRINKCQYISLYWASQPETHRLSIMEQPQWCITPNHSMNGVMADCPSIKQAWPWDLLQFHLKSFIIDLVFVIKMNAFSLVHNLVNHKILCIPLLTQVNMVNRHVCQVKTVMVLLVSKKNQDENVQATGMYLILSICIFNVFVYLNDAYFTILRYAENTLLNIRCVMVC